MPSPSAASSSSGSRIETTARKPRSLLCTRRPRSTSVAASRVDPRAHGPWWIAWTDGGICAGACGSWEERRFRAFLDAHHDGPARRGDPGEAPEGIDWRFVRPGFRRDVLRACAEIPAGEVRTYGEL